MASAVSGTEGKWMRSSSFGAEVESELEIHESRMEVMLKRYWRNWLLV